MTDTIPTPPKKDTSTLAKHIWDTSKPTDLHPYLMKKGVYGDYHLRLNTYQGLSSLVVPFSNGKELTAVQLIGEDGSKKFQGTKKGSYAILNKTDSPKIIGIGEGFATVASIIENESSIMGVVAGDAGNLQPVAIAIKERFPNADIVIFADANDENHTGEKCAKEAASAIGCQWVVPPNHGEKIDFNDYILANPNASILSLIKPPKRKLKLIDGDELAASAKAPNFMINNILETHSHGMMIGDSESFKSFLVLGMARAICTGQPFLGNQVFESGKVLYVCGEGNEGLKRRLKGIRGGFKNNLIVIDEYITINSVEFLTMLEDAVKEHDIKLVIADTYSSLSGGTDEQSNAEVAMILRAMQNACGKASSITIHHFGKDKSKGARGASAFRANADFVYTVEREENSFRGKLTCNKMKDADHFKDQFFVAKEVPLMGLVRQDGTMTTTLVIEAGLSISASEEPEPFDERLLKIITVRDKLQFKLENKGMKILDNTYLIPVINAIGNKSNVPFKQADIVQKVYSLNKTEGDNEESEKVMIRRLLGKLGEHGIITSTPDKRLMITQRGVEIINLIIELNRLKNEDTTVVIPVVVGGNSGNSAVNSGNSAVNSAVNSGNSAVNSGNSISMAELPDWLK